MKTYTSSDRKDLQDAFDQLKSQMAEHIFGLCNGFFSVNMLWKMRVRAKDNAVPNRGGDLPKQWIGIMPAVSKPQKVHLKRYAQFFCPAAQALHFSLIKDGVTLIMHYVRVGNI